MTEALSNFQIAGNPAGDGPRDHREVSKYLHWRLSVEQTGVAKLRTVVGNDNVRVSVSWWLKQTLASNARLRCAWFFCFSEIGA